MRKKPPIKKPWSPTEAQRDQVEMMVAVNASVREISLALGVTANTLRKHCKLELTKGRSKKRSELVSLLWGSARSGNVSAQKKLIDMTDRAAAEAAFVPAEPDAVKARPLGKKEEAALAAETAGQGTDWASDLGLGDEARPN
jgi:DNA-binding CsgD family transcriptional regulator